jgi:hypothetical protein
MMDKDFVIDFALGALFTVTLAFVVVFISEIPIALKNAKIEREDRTPRKKSCLRAWAWLFLVKLPILVTVTRARVLLAVHSWRT